MGRIWRHFSFSARFTVLLLIAGMAIAAVPLLLAAGDASASALGRAQDRAQVVTSLVETQRQALVAYTNEVALQLAAKPDGTNTDVAGTLRSDTQITPDEVLGYVSGSSSVISRNGQLVSQLDPLATAAIAASTNKQSLVADAAGQPWLVASQSLTGSAAVIFAAQPQAQVNLPDTVVVYNNRVITAGLVGPANLAVGADVPPQAAALISSNGAAQVVGFGSGSYALAVARIGGGFAAVVTSPVDNASVVGYSGLAILLVVLCGMLVIRTVVEHDLQRPLRRLDRAAAEMGHGNWLEPVATVAGQDEVARLAKTFEEMRQQLHASIQESEARAAIAAEFNAPQPLQVALESVCEKLQAAAKASSTTVVVADSEIGDAFTAGSDLGIEDSELLTTPGPIASAFQSSGVAIEFSQGLCTVPLQFRDRRLGVVAMGLENQPGESVSSLLLSTAEQIALAVERYRVIAVVQQQATVDDLTTLYNHRFLVDYIGQQVAIAERLDSPLAVLMLDIDHFKRVNDTYGHHIGDVALRRVAEVIKQTIRRSDLAGRYGGEEFVVVMPDTDQSEAVGVAEKIRAAVSETHVVVDTAGATLDVTISIGVAGYPEDTSTASELMRLADEALYVAKGSGRNRVAEATRKATATRQPSFLDAARLDVESREPR